MHICERMRATRETPGSFPQHRSHATHDGHRTAVIGNRLGTRPRPIILRDRFPLLATRAMEDRGGFEFVDGDAGWLGRSRGVRSAALSRHSPLRPGRRFISHSGSGAVSGRAAPRKRSSHPFRGWFRLSLRLVDRISGKSIWGLQLCTREY